MSNQSCTSREAGMAPKYTVSDKGSQFWCPRFKGWCKSRRPLPRIRLKRTA